MPSHALTKPARLRAIIKKCLVAYGLRGYKCTSVQINKPKYGGRGVWATVTIFDNKEFIVHIDKDLPEDKETSVLAHECAHILTHKLISSVIDGRPHRRCEERLCNLLARLYCGTVVRPG